MTADELLRKHKDNWRHRDGNGAIIPFSSQPDSWIAFRTYRAISWLRHAEQHAARDIDAAFIFQWIAFDAAYGSKREPEWLARQTFFRELLEQDRDNAIYDAIWHRFSNPVRALLGNEYLFGPYLDELTGEPSVPNWTEAFKRKNRKVLRDLTDGTKTMTTLAEVFDRLYALRNQLFHGGAKWGSTRNRDSVRSCEAIMAFLVPVFLEIMIDRRERLRLGEPRYYLQGDGP